MSITSPVRMRNLLAATGSPVGASVGLPGGRAVPLPLARAAELYTAWLEDRRAYSLYALREDQVDDVRVTFTSSADGSELVAEIEPSSLRYMIDPSPAGEPLMRLCQRPGCPAERLGRVLLTAYCTDHLDTIIPGLLPNAGDDIFPGDREEAAAESRTRRLAAHVQETEERKRDAEGEHRVALHIQAQHQPAQERP